MLTVRVYENVDFNVVPFAPKGPPSPEDDRVYDYAVLDGLIHGDVNICTAGGRRLATLEARHGLAHGYARTYGRDGRVQHEFRFRNGRLYGQFAPVHLADLRLPTELCDALLRLELLEDAGTTPTLPTPPPFAA